MNTVKEESAVSVQTNLAEQSIMTWRRGKHDFVCFCKSGVALRSNKD